MNENISILTLYKNGITPLEMEKENITISDMYRNGISVRELLKFYTIKYLYDNGISIQNFLKEGLTPSQLYNGGISLIDLHNNGVSINMMLNDGIIKQDLIDVNIIRKYDKVVDVGTEGVYLSKQNLWLDQCQYLCDETGDCTDINYGYPEATTCNILKLVDTLYKPENVYYREITKSKIIPYKYTGRNYTQYKNVSLRWGNLGSVGNMYLNQCKDKCNANPSCVQFSFNDLNPRNKWACTLYWEWDAVGGSEIIYRTGGALSMYVPPPPVQVSSGNDGGMWMCPPGTTSQFNAYGGWTRCA